MISKIFQQFGRKSPVKTSKLSKSFSGFTLLELLVAMVIASVIVSSLLTFLFSVLDTDRKEQAKVDSQEEIQSALNFIADDLQQAVYIYDADGLYIPSATSAPLPPSPPLQQRIVDQIPSNSTLPPGSNVTITPVLVFWKRNQYKLDDQIRTSAVVPTDKFVGCLEFQTNTAPECLDSGRPKGGDKFVFSLVAYYLVKPTVPSSTWSNSARIARWEIKDGIRWACRDGRSPGDTPPSVCPATDRRQRDDVPTTGVGFNVDPNHYVVLPDQGFIRFDASGSGTLSDRMNRWRIGGPTNPNQTPKVLLDYVDDTPYIPAQDAVGGSSPIRIGLEPNAVPSGATFPLTTQSRNPDCDRADTGVGVGLTDAQVGNLAVQTVFSQRIPPDFGSATYNPTGLSSFYACVNAKQVVARVYIRGNALARLVNDPNSRIITDDKRASFVPTSSVRAFGRGAIGIEQ